MMGPRALSITCANEGLLAAPTGAPCPYGRDRPFSRRAWIMGYVAGRRRAGLPTAADRIAEETAELS